jgi:hypothetical protein
MMQKKTKGEFLEEYLKYAFRRTSSFYIDSTLPYLTKSINNTCLLKKHFNNLDTLVALDQLTKNFQIISCKQATVIFLASSIHLGIFEHRRIKTDHVYRFTFTDFFTLRCMSDYRLCDTESILKALKIY